MTYGHSRCFLDIADPGRTNPQTGHHEDRPTPTGRTFETMHKDALEYKALLDKKPSAAKKHYEQHGRARQPRSIGCRMSGMRWLMPCMWYTHTNALRPLLTP